MSSQTTRRAGAAPAGGAAVDPRRVGLAALTVLLGMQSLRTLLPLLVFLFRDRFEWNAVGVGLLSFAVFATGFLAAPLRALLGPGRFLVLTAGGVAVLRLALQLWTRDPLVDFALALAATVLFFLALAALVADRAPAGSAPGAAGSLALGWALGLAAETALHAAWGTWDLSWRADAATLAVVAALVLAQWRFLAAVTRSSRDLGRPADVAFPVAWTWIALGPFLFLELLVLGNVARLAALSGWSSEVAGVWAVAGRLVAAAAVFASLARPLHWRQAAALGAALIALSALPWPAGTPAALYLLGQQVIAVVLLARIVQAIGGAPRSSGLKRLTAAHGLGLLVLAALFFLYYGGIDLRLPVAEEALPPLAALGLAAAAAAAARRAPQAPGARAAAPGLLALASLALALLALPLARLATAPAIRTGEPTGFPLRLMTYNLHCGIDPRGHLGLEAIAAVIEAQKPDVVALQEVSRGWVIVGSVDAAAWLSRRLGMPYLFAPTADPLWGNAILSRLPIASHETRELPTRELLIRRGFVSARIDLGDAGHLEAIVTHYHHPRPGGAIRELQSQALLDFWRSRERTAILGDFNARPGEPEIEALRRAGLGEVLDLAGVDPGYTHSARVPNQRIDYIWISPDLAVREAWVPPDPASDHLPVVAVVDVR